MIKIPYVVHDSVRMDIEDEVQLRDGSKKLMPVPGLHVQIMPANGLGGTAKMEFIGDDEVNAAVAEFGEGPTAEGRKVTVTIESAE